MSVEKIVQDAVAAVLEGDLASLRIDARPVCVQRFLPEQAFSSRPPMIVVERPTVAAKEAWDSARDREEQVVPISFVDVCKPTADDFEACQERLDELRRKFEARLRARPYLGLASFSVMPGTWSLARVPGEPDNLGNNLMSISWRLTVPVIVPHGGS